ncbi:MAG: DUF4397 domain-containing protein [Myxococcota bacterium]
MSIYKNTLPLLMTLTMTLSAVACGDDSDDSGSSDTPDGGADNGGEDAPAAIPSAVRTAHLSPDVPPVDFCFVPADGDPIGPVLEESGLRDGIAFGDITPYLPVEEGIYAVRVVADDATDCTAAVTEFPSVAVPAGGFEITAAVVGFADPATDPELELIFWIDDNNDPAADRSKLRFIHTSPGTPAVDAGLLAPGQITLAEDDILFDTITYKQTASPAYVELEPLADSTMRVQAADDPNVGVDLSGLTIPAGTVATVFAIGELADLRVLVCIDNDDGSCSLP